MTYSVLTNRTIQKLTALAVFCAVVAMPFVSTAAAIKGSNTATTTIPKQVFSLESIPTSPELRDFVVGPGKFEVTLAPGQSQTIDLSVSNRLGVDRTFTLVEEDFVGSNDPTKTTVLLGDDRGPYSLKDYLKIGADSVSIPTGQRARIPVTVMVPADAQPGGYYGSVIVAVSSSRNAGESVGGAIPTNPIISRIATLFFVRVAGPVKEDGRITKFSLPGDRTVLWSPQSIDFDLYYRNDGTVHEDPFGTITVKNMLGSTVGSIDVEPWFAMPNSLRFREVRWQTPFLFGRYVAHASIDRGYGSVKDEVDLVFWVIPWKLLVVIIVGLFVVIFGIRYIKARFKIVSTRNS